jgi:hypothetical protein
LGLSISRTRAAAAASFCLSTAISATAARDRGAVDHNNIL